MQNMISTQHIAGGNDVELFCFNFTKWNFLCRFSVRVVDITRVEYKKLRMDGGG